MHNHHNHHDNHHHRFCPICGEPIHETPFHYGAHNHETADMQGFSTSLMLFLGLLLLGVLVFRTNTFTPNPTQLVPVQRNAAVQ